MFDNGVAGLTVPEVVTVDDLRRAQLDDLLDAVEHQRRAEVAQLAAIHSLCELYGARDLDEFIPLTDPTGTVPHALAGLSQAGAAEMLQGIKERFLAGGHDGTPEVSEFLCLELGAALGISPTSAARRIAEVLDLVHRHPVLHAEVMAGRVRMWQANAIIRETSSAGLSGEAARWVDAQIGGVVAGLAHGRVLKLVRGLIAKADPALAEQRAMAERERRRARVITPDWGGLTGELHATLDLVDATVLNSTLRMVAARLAELGDPDSLDVRRARALGVLATPARALAILQGSTHRLRRAACATRG